MTDFNSMSDAEKDEIIDKALTQTGRDPQLRIAESLAEIAIQLQKLNEHLDTTVKHGLSGIASAQLQRH